MDQPNLLTPLKKAFLDEFFQQAIGQEFFLTGGTALAAFYLQHRYSEDIDLFTLNETALYEASRSLPTLAANLGAVYEERPRTPSFQQAFIRTPTEQIKIDFVRDVGTQFGEHLHQGAIVIDSELNIAVNKITAIFGRTTPKDFVDLYFLLKKGYDLNQLMQMAKEKDLGFTEFYFAGMLRASRRLNALPRMIAPLDLEALRAFYATLATQVMLNLNPRE